MDVCCRHIHFTTVFESASARAIFIRFQPPRRLWGRLSHFCREQDVCQSVTLVNCDHSAMHCGYFDTVQKGNHSSFLTPAVIGGRRSLPSEICAQGAFRKLTSIICNRYALLRTGSLHIFPYMLNICIIESLISQGSLATCLR